MFKRLHALTLFLCMGLSASVMAAEGSALTEAMVNPGYHEKPDWFKLSFLDIREDVQEAADNNKRVLLYFYQDGCPYCKKLLEDNFGQRTIAEKTQKHFDVIAINMWGDREVTNFKGDSIIEKQFAADLKVNFTPTLLFLDEKGEVVLRVNGYYFPEKFDVALDFVSQKMEGKMAFADYLKQRAPVKSTGKLHMEAGFVQPPYKFNQVMKQNNKPLLVLFEQKDCKACDELHLDILKRQEPRSAMQKFNIALVDIHADAPVVTPQGDKMTAREWAKKLNIKYSPSLVFFDTQGKEVFRTEAYLKTFHVNGAMTYVSSGAYVKQPSFQRYLQAVTEELHKQGKQVNLMD